MRSLFAHSSPYPDIFATMSKGEQVVDEKPQFSSAESSDDTHRKGKEEQVSPQEDMNEMMIHPEVKRPEVFQASESLHSKITKTESSHRREPVKSATSAISGQGSNSPVFNEQDIVDQVMGLLAAGLGPLAVAMTFVIYCLAVHEDEQERVCREINDIILNTVSIENTRSGIDLT